MGVLDELKQEVEDLKAKKGEDQQTTQADTAEPRCDVNGGST